VETGQHDEGLPGGREGSCVPRGEGWLEGFLGGVGSALHGEAAGGGDAEGDCVQGAIRSLGGLERAGHQALSALRSARRRKDLRGRGQGRCDVEQGMTGRRRCLAAQRFGALSEGQRALSVAGEPAGAGQ
jgi:hypothetical protein